MGKAVVGEKQRRAARRTPRQVLERYGIYLALVVGLLVTAVVAPAFFQPGNLFNVLRHAAILAIVAVGQTFALLGGGIDLSVGGVMGLVLVLMADLTGGTDRLVVPVTLVCLGAGALVGLLNGLLVTKRNVPPFVATLGMLIFIEGVRLAYTKAVPSGGVPPLLRLLGRDSWGPVPVALIVAAAIALLAGLVLYRMTFGRAVYATGGNPEAAHLSGIAVDRTRVLTYVVCSVLAGVAGLMLGGYIGYVDRYIGRGFEFDSIAAAVVGGTSFLGGRGTIGGTLAGALLMTALLNTVLILNLGIQAQLIVRGVVIVAAVALYSLATRRD